MKPPPPVAPAAPGPRPSLLGTLVLGLVACTWVLAFAPKPVALASLTGIVAVLALVERARTTWAAVRWLVLFAAIAIGVGYGWVAATIRTFGEFDARFGAFAGPASYAGLAVHAIAATIHLGLFAALYRVTLRHGRPHPVATALLFVACESLPIRFLPWTAAYGAVDVGPLRQVAEWGGLPLTSFALLCLTIPVHEGLRGLARVPARPRAALATFLVGLLFVGAGAARSAQVEAQDRDATDRVRVGLVQPGVGSGRKRAAERGRSDEGRKSREALERETRRALDAGARLIVWPETALVEGLPLGDLDDGKAFPGAAVDRRLSALGYGFLDDVGRESAVLLGAYVDVGRASGGEKPRRYNSALLREEGGKAWSLYRKVRLMPFGESMPGAEIAPGLNDLLPQSFRMTSGSPDQPPLAWKSRGLRLCSFVCYESILPRLVARLAGDERPDLLVNLTNDSWYGDTWEPRQHLNFARFRAVEHRAPLLRATNTGISAFVSSTGEVTDRLPYDEAGILVADVPLVRRDRTLYARIAPWVEPASWLAGLLVLFAARRRRLAAMQPV